jgi:hypothetical protein
MSGGFNQDDYIDVAERIRLFFEKYPDGRLETQTPPSAFHVGEKTFVWIQAAAYRTPDDPHPAIGTAWEPIPGPTPFTRDSEAMNAETAAWGRAIIAAGIPSKKIASADEVQARRTEPEPAKVTKAQHAKIGVIIKALTELRPDTDWVEYSREWVGVNYGKTSRADLLANEASVLIEHLQQLEAECKAAA